jgi:hypothetical protein
MSGVVALYAFGAIFGPLGMLQLFSPLVFYTFLFYFILIFILFFEF